MTRVLPLVQWYFGEPGNFFLKVEFHRSNRLVQVLLINNSSNDNQGEKGKILTI